MTWGEGEPARMARGMWSLLEPVHALTYFDPRALEAFTAAGLRGFWRGYFAGRSAPLGPAGPAVVTSLFYNFAPRMVERALPGVWSRIGPDEALAVRAAGAATALRPLAADPGVVRELADALWPRSAQAPSGGRALGAANAALPRPDDPHQALWQAATTFRELRGDGHVAALVSAGLSGLDALVLRSGLDLDAELLLQARGWSAEEWSAAATGLVRRGLVVRGTGTSLAITPEGRRLLADVEARTDQAAATAWTGPEGSDAGPAPVLELATRLLPIARACLDRLPRVNPIGLARPWDAATDPRGPSAPVAL